MTTVDATNETTVGGVHYRVSSSYVAGAADATNKTSIEIDGLLDGIRSYVVTLEEAWQGIAFQQFQIMMTNYDNYAKRLNDALVGISNGLHGTYSNYTEAELENLNNLHTVDTPPPANFQ